MSPSSPCTTRPPTICYLAAAAASNLLRHQPPACYHLSLQHIPSPFSNLNNVALALSVAALRVHTCTFICCSALALILLYGHQTLYLATTPGNPLLPIYRRPFHPLLPHAGAQACLANATIPRMESSLLPVIDKGQGCKAVVSLDYTLNDGSLLLFSGRHHNGPHSLALTRLISACTSPWAVKAVSNMPRRRRCADPTCMRCTRCVGWTAPLTRLCASWDFQ